MKNNKKLLWRTVLVISLVGCICCLGFVAWYLYQDYREQKAYEQLQEDVDESTTEFDGETEGEAAELPDGVFLDLENPIDFDLLADINTDIYAWIRISDTSIDYPIAQREGDDAYYLSHDMYQESRFAGCIYTEEANSKDFTDPNTVIYGHNMRNGSMFQNLHYFEDATFFDEHPYVYIYTPEHVLVYEVFASYSYDNRHILNSFDFSDEEVYAQYLEDILNVRSMDKNIRDDVTVTTEDTIITLSTCIGGDSDARYLVQAVLIKDESDE
ncbi:MAG: class B sortase [Clostridiales bacterium]|nr:class B sortase [Clostridiales bacterium]